MGERVNCKDLVLDNVKFFGLVYGGIGSGKTRLFDTCPKPCYVFCTDPRGMDSLRGRDVEYDYYTDKIVNDITVETAWKQIFLRIAEMQRECKYATVGIDSVTTLQDSCMLQILKDSGKRRPEFQQWGDVISRLQDLFIRLGTLNAHVLITAHESMEKDEVAGSIKVCPNFVGKKLPQTGGLYFSEVYRLIVQKGEKGKLDRWLCTERGENFDAKSRLGCLNPTEPPDITAILRKAGVVK